MSNHYHVVLHIRSDIAEAWTDKEVIEHWHCLFSGNTLSRLFLSNQTLSKSQLEALNQSIKLWRERLMDISWFMRTVNEFIARKANIEDNCSGRFWEGRFKSQALLDEKALLSCMAYVDLNPIRAGIADTPEESDHTSIKKHIDCIQTNQPTPLTLETFIENATNENCIPFALIDYLELVDWTGRIIREDKKGAIKITTPPILERLALNQNAWKTLSTTFEQAFKQWVGSHTKVQKLYKDKNYQRIPSTKIIKPYLVNIKKYSNKPSRP